MRFHLCPTLALAGRNDRSKSLHRPTLPTIWSISTTLVPRWRRLLAACSLLTSSKESNRFEVCSLRIRDTSARRQARRLARVKSASTCSYRFMYGIISSSLLEIGLRNKRNKGERLWRVIQTSGQPGGLPGKHEQEEVGHDGQAHAQDHAGQQPEQAPPAETQGYAASLPAEDAAFLLHRSLYLLHTIGAAK